LCLLFTVDRMPFNLMDFKWILSIKTPSKRKPPRPLPQFSLIRAL
jgi:hypothetical protein